MLKQSTVLDFKGQNFYVGIDVHLKVNMRPSTYCSGVF